MKDKQEKNSYENNAQWIDNKYARFYNTQHYDDWDPRFFEKYDLKKLIESWEKLDPDVVVGTARTHVGKWFCDVGWGGMHKGLKGADQLKALSQYARSKGKPIIAYFSVVYDKAIYDEHPDWRQINADGSPISKSLERGWWHTGAVVVCPNSPYKDYLISMIKQLLKTQDIDGIWFDMIWFLEKPCYCASCRQLFKSKYGAEPPTTIDWDDPLFRKFIKFRINSNYLFVREICEAVKKVNPKLSTSAQFIMFKTGDNMTGQTLAVGAVPDYLYSDVYFENGYLQMSVVCKALAAVSRHKYEIGLMTRPGSHNDTPNMMPLDQIRSSAFTAIANGGTLSFFDIMWSDGTVQEVMWDRIKKVSDEVRTRVPWLGGKSIKSVGVFYSEKTRIWYGRSDRRGRYDVNVFGACRALIEEHIPFNILTSLDKESLEGYQAIFLPNAVCMSSEEIEAVRSFVKNGGGLVCTEKTSLWDENGEPCDEYGLNDVLGVSHVSDTAAYPRVYSRYDISRSPAKRLPSDGLITNWGPVQKINIKSAETLAKIVYPYTKPTAEKIVNIMANPPAIETDWPACTYNEYGQGKVVYFPGAIDKDYLTLSFPELKWLIGDAVKMVSKTPLQVELKAPISVEITAFEKVEEGAQLIVHLVNYQPEIGKNYIERDTQTNKFESRHLVQEILPVYDLELKVRNSKKVKKITLQPEGKELSFKQTNEEILVKISRLDCHSMVVIDF